MYPDKTKPDDGLLIPIIFFLLTIITRIPFTSKLLYHMDSVQFALALEKYDITVHQPHPPGYFLYVMLGRALNFFIKDANTVFVSISIVFSGLTVVAVYYLGKELFDKKIGLLAGVLALTSPNLWFHGEVALSYIVEAFFSTLVAYLCWRIHRGEHRYIWPSVITLGIAGGIRQNTIVFLLPLWLFSTKGVPVRKLIASLGLLGLVCLLWFVPMVWMAGGWDTYRDAFRELWLFNTGNVSVFERGWPSFKIFSSALFVFIVYGIGAGVFVLSLASYLLIKHRKLKSLDKNKVAFFSLWGFPPILFYLLIFIHPGNPGYALIFLPAFFLLTAASVGYVADAFKRMIKLDIYFLMITALISVNTSFFVFSKLPVSNSTIRDHDRSLSAVLNSIRSFDPAETAVFVPPYMFFSYRQIMFYLPEYMVYQVDVRVAPTGEVRKAFWGLNRQTFVTDRVLLPKRISSFVTILIHDHYKIAGIEGVIIKSLPHAGINIASGHISLLTEIYPELRLWLRK